MAISKKPRPASAGAGEEQEGAALPSVLTFRRTGGLSGCLHVGDADGGEQTSVAKRPHRVDDGGEGVKAFLAQKRLVLVLDLDHTLLHSVGLHLLTPAEAYLLHQRLPQPSSSSTQRLLKTKEGFITKLRPFVRTFLREAKAMYHLCICTMGNQRYAQKMTRLLDPDGIYFLSGDIVSRSDFSDNDRKGLDAIRWGDERTTVILDDTVAVWERHRANLIPIPPYHYFAHSQHKHGLTGQSLAELRKDEDKSVGALSTALHLLRRVHSEFFHPSAGSESDLSCRDVREVLKDVMLRVS